LKFNSENFVAAYVPRGSRVWLYQPLWLFISNK